MRFRAPWYCTRRARRCSPWSKLYERRTSRSSPSLLRKARVTGQALAIRYSAPMRAGPGALTYYGAVLVLALAVGSTAYAQVIDPVQTLSDTDDIPESGFGSSTAVRGGIVAAFAPRSQRVVIFEFEESGGWVEHQVLAAEDVDSSGTDVPSMAEVELALGDGFLIVGAPQHSAGGRERTGAAYVFRRQDSGVWEWQATLARGELADAECGSSLALGGSLLVGCRGEQDARFFAQDEGGAWSEQGLLVDSAGVLALALSRFAIVTKTTGEGASVYRRDREGAWLLDAVIPAPDDAMQFGSAVSFFVDDVLIVDAPAGRVHLLARVGVDWVEQARFEQATAAAWSNLGDAVVARWNEGESGELVVLQRPRWTARSTLPIGRVSRLDSGFFLGASTRMPDGHDVVELFRVARPLGAECTDGLQCVSSLCVDGLCCDAACEGQCEACDVPRNEGMCTLVRGAPRGDREACLGSDRFCAGRCDGESLECLYVETAPGCLMCSLGDCEVREAPMDAGPPEFPMPWPEPDAGDSGPGESGGCSAPGANAGSSWVALVILGAWLLRRRSVR